jgi:hypothetical protein
VGIPTPLQARLYASGYPAARSDNPVWLRPIEKPSSESKKKQHDVPTPIFHSFRFRFFSMIFKNK